MSDGRTDGDLTRGEEVRGLSMAHLDRDISAGHLGQKIQKSSVGSVNCLARVHVGCPVAQVCVAATFLDFSGCRLCAVGLKQLSGAARDVGGSRRIAVVVVDYIHLIITRTARIRACLSGVRSVRSSSASLCEQPGSGEELQHLAKGRKQHLDHNRFSYVRCGPTHLAKQTQ